MKCKFGFSTTGQGENVVRRGRPPLHGEKMKSFTLYLPDAIYNALGAEAAMENRQMAAQVRQILSERYKEILPQ